MDINVKLLDESTVAIKVEASSTIQDLKAVIQGKKRIPPNEQCLIFAGRELENEHTVSSYGIQQDSTIIMSRPLGTGSCRIYARLSTGETVILMLERCDTIGHIRALIQEKIGHLSRQMRMSFAGKQVEDTHTLADYGMLNGSVVHLVLIDRQVDSSDEINSESDSDSESSGNPPFNATARQPIPAIVAQLISRLCEKHDVKSALFVQDPADWKSIVITGLNVSRIEPELRALQTDSPDLQTDFPDLRLDVQEQNGPLFTKQLIRSSTIKVEKKSPTSLTASTWRADELATTEFFVSAHERNKDKPSPQGAIYAVLPAHLVMKETQNEEYAHVDSNLAFARSDVEGETTRTRYTAMADGNSRTTVDLKHPPLFSYRHWFSKNSESKFMSDIALLQLDRSQAERLQLHVKRCQPKIRRTIREIPSKEALQSLCQRNQRVLIANAKGYLVPFPQEVVQEAERRDRKSYCLHLPFILTSKDLSGKTDKLKPGHCGSILYYKSSEGKLLPMGLFVGQLKVTFPSGTVIYQAIILSEALKDIERDYPHQLANIQPLRDAGNIIIDY